MQERRVINVFLVDKEETEGRYKDYCDWLE
jgi:hypothetical protein